ncbi:MAG: hypothetical protein J6S85_13220 [Methanobrevibacter sp.]|nr:hypothetical protein [Methanobrevibacter sp.]
MTNYRKVNRDTYLATVTVEHWYYGSYFAYYEIELSDDDNCLENILNDILKNENDFRFISWEKATLSIDFVIDNKVYTKTVIIE